MQTPDDILHDYMDEALSMDDVLEYLNHMPHNRESADELLEATDCFDMAQIYETLLRDFADILSDDEIEALKEKFTSTFDLPLPEED